MPILLAYICTIKIQNSIVYAKRTLIKWAENLRPGKFWPKDEPEHLHFHFSKSQIKSGDADSRWLSFEAFLLILLFLFGKWPMCMCRSLGRVVTCASPIFEGKKLPSTYARTKLRIEPTAGPLVRFSFIQ